METGYLDRKNLLTWQGFVIQLLRYHTTKHPPTTFLRKDCEMAKRKTKKATGAKKPMTKSEIMTALAESNGFTKKEIAGLFEDLSGLIAKNLGRRGPGVFTIPGLTKIRVVRKPATKARKGINPFTGEETVFKAKPARNVVKMTALKALKDMVK